MKKSISAIFWIIAVLTAPVALSAETALPEAFKITNFDRPSRDITDWVTNFAKFHKVIVNGGIEKLLTSKNGAKVGFDEALTTLGFTREVRSPEKMTEKAALDFIREGLVSNGPVFTVNAGVYELQTGMRRLNEGV
jgi:hypothetical protein